MQIRSPLMGIVPTIPTVKSGADPIPEEFKALHALLHDPNNVPGGIFTPQPPIHVPEVLSVQAGGVPKPQVISMPSPNYNNRPAGTDIDTIVLHHTATGGTAQNVGNFFKNPAAEVSAHYTVGKDGAIVQSVPDSKRSWHAGNSEFKGKHDVNDFSIGIEIVNLGNGSDPYTDKQYDAIINLVAYLMEAHGVPMDRITGHKDIALPRGRKSDPSNNFDWGRVRRGVEAKLNGKSPAPAPAPQPAPNPGPGGNYTVRKGDSLSKIARDVLGDVNRWREIYDLNKNVIGSNPNVIHAGMNLKMPGKAEEPKPAPKPEPKPEPKPDPKPAPKPEPKPEPAPQQPATPPAAPPATQPTPQAALPPSTPVLLGVSPAAIWQQIQAMNAVTTPVTAAQTMPQVAYQPLPQIAYQPYPSASYPQQQATYPQVTAATYPQTTYQAAYPQTAYAQTGYPQTSLPPVATPTVVAQSPYYPAAATGWTGPMVAQAYPAAPATYPSATPAYATPTPAVPAVQAPNPLGVEWVG